MLTSWARLVLGTVAPHRVEDAGEPPRQGHHGHTHTSAGRDPLRPLPQGLGVRAARAPDAPCRLHQQPAHPGIAGLGERTSVLSFARAPLAWYQSQVALHLMRPLESLDLI